MRKLTAIILFALVLPLVMASSAVAQTGAWGKPDPLTINIANIEQKNNYWCWPAIIEQIINWRGMGSSPSQCELVNIANAYKGWQAINCCDDSARAECSRAGTEEEIKNLITLYGGRATNINPPTTAEEIYGHLMAKRVLLMGVEIEGTNNSHLYMVRGISWAGDEAMLTINDPAVSQSQTIKFSDAQNTWFYSLAVE